MHIFGKLLIPSKVLWIYKIPNNWVNGCLVEFILSKFVETFNPCHQQCSLIHTWRGYVLSLILWSDVLGIMGPWICRCCRCHPLTLGTNCMTWKWSPYIIWLFDRKRSQYIIHLNEWWTRKTSPITTHTPYFLDSTPLPTSGLNIVSSLSEKLRIWCLCLWSCIFWGQWTPCVQHLENEEQEFSLIFLI